MHLLKKLAVTVLQHLTQERNAVQIECDALREALLETQEREAKALGDLEYAREEIAEGLSDRDDLLKRYVQTRDEIDRLHLAAVQAGHDLDHVRAAQENVTRERNSAQALASAKHDELLNARGKLEALVSLVKDDSPGREVEEWIEANT